MSRLDFYAAAIALAGVLLLGILEGILLAALASILLLLARASRPHVAFLGRVPGTNRYSDLARHPENEALPGVIAFRPEASLISINSDAVLETVSTAFAWSLHPTSAWWSATSRRRPTSISRARACCMSCTASSLPAASRCVLSGRTAGRAICCDPTAWATKSAG